MAVAYGCFREPGSREYKLDRSDQDVTSDGIRVLPREPGRGSSITVMALLPSTTVR